MLDLASLPGCRKLEDTMAWQGGKREILRQGIRAVKRSGSVQESIGNAVSKIETHYNVEIEILRGRQTRVARDFPL